jgi:hypothetical protein
MVRTLGLKPNARAVVQPQTLAFWLLHRNFQPLTFPDPFDTLVIDKPARTPEQFCDPAIAVATVVACERDDVGGQPFFIVTAARPFALSRTMLTEHLAKPALGNGKQAPDMRDASPATRGAQ